MTSDQFTFQNVIESYSPSSLPHNQRILLSNIITNIVSNTIWNILNIWNGVVSQALIGSLTLTIKNTFLSSASIQNKDTTDLLSTIEKLTRVHIQQEVEKCWLSTEDTNQIPRWKITWDNLCTIDRGASIKIRRNYFFQQYSKYIPDMYANAPINLIWLGTWNIKYEWWQNHVGIFRDTHGTIFLVLKDVLDKSHIEHVWSVGKVLWKFVYMESHDVRLDHPAVTWIYEIFWTNVIYTNLDFDDLNLRSPIKIEFYQNAITWEIHGNHEGSIELALGSKFMKS